MWIIPGGPGQHSNDIEIWIPKFLALLPPNTILYLMDHRGTGKSEKIVSSKKQNECLENLERCAAQSPVPWPVLSIHNAAMDFIAVTRSMIGVSEDSTSQTACETSMVHLRCIIWSITHQLHISTGTRLV